MFFGLPMQGSVDSVHCLQTMLDQYCVIEGSKYPDLEELMNLLFQVGVKHGEGFLVRMLSKKYDTIGTPPHYAAVYGHGEGVSKFIQTLSDGHTLSLVKVFKYDDSGEGSWTVIHEAAYYGNVDFLNLMYLFVPAPVQAILRTVRYDGLTAIEWARRQGCEEAAKQIESYDSVDSIRMLCAHADKREEKRLDENKVIILERTTPLLREWYVQFISQEMKYCPDTQPNIFYELFCHSL